MSLHCPQLSSPARVVTVTPPSASPSPVPGTVARQRFSGSIDSQNVADVAAVLDDILARTPGSAIIDLTAVDFVNVSGVVVLARFCEDATSAGIVVTCAASGGVLRCVAVCASAIPPDQFSSTGQLSSTAQLSFTALREALDVASADNAVA
ncbi:STAS domain-containing protein [Gordonia aichiensis]|uniref:STAS domain-containing protein n=1 Tax=Gordonia aichiensis TaxID=36820 RepID=UPI000A054B0F|nr:STAS domain-containing protein [Gordonia aichiensis]